MKSGLEKIKKCFEEAKIVLKSCVTPYGFFASGGKKGYNAVWARDSIISSLGGSLIKDKYGRIFKEAFKKSLITLAKEQAKNGQIPNAVDKFSKRKPHVDFQSIDSTLWFIIGNYVYKERYGEELKSLKKNVKKALDWLKAQDWSNKGLLIQLPTTDWQDAFPHKYGHCISTQALYYKVLRLIKEEKEAENLKFRVNKDRELKLWEKDRYLAYRWKNHNKYREVGTWFDSLGNLLAIVFELADPSQGKKILEFIKKKKIDKPYPVRAIYPPIKKGSEEWKDYFMDCDAREEWSYANGGIWGFIGGFYILALLKLEKFKEAEEALKKLSEMELKGNFPEWTHPITRKSYGELQAWEAGMYILAYESFLKKKVLI